jgi:hypothetical protein
MPVSQRRLGRLGTGVLVALAAACEGGDVGPSPRVGSVVMVDPPASLAVGEMVRLSAAVAGPSGEPLSGKPVYWGAVDTTVVQVDSVTGVARARSPGTTRIAASSEDKYAVADVVVPEGPPIGFNTLVNDELSVADDADEFTLDGTAGQEVNVFLRGTSEVAAHQFRLRLLGPGRDVIDTVSSRGNDPVLRRQAIEWRKLPQTGRYRIRVDGSLGTDRGSYQFMVQRVDTAPEKLVPAIPLGALVSGEDLAPGDVDTFTFPGTTGQELNLLFRARSGSGNDALRLRLLSPTGEERVFVQCNGDYATAQASGRIQLLQSGPYTVRVQGFDAEDQGPYEFQVLPISRGPERIVAAVAANSVVTGEDLSPIGDVDEFTYNVAAQQQVNVYFRAIKGTAADSLALRVVDPSRGVDSVRGTVAVVGIDTLLYAQSVGHVTLGPGTAHIRVEGGRYTHLGYSFQVRTINLAPETAGATVPLGAYVTEAISPVGDVDQFRLHANAGDSIRISFQATSGSAADVLRLFLDQPNGFENLFVHTTGSQAEQTIDVRLPLTGDYTIRVQGLNSNDDSGPYRFKVVKLN